MGFFWPKYVLRCIFPPQLLLTSAKAITLIPFTSDVHEDLLHYTMGIVFLGTPFKGANGIGAAQLRILVSSAMGNECSDRLLNHLERDNTYLFKLVNEFSVFAQNKMKISIWCFYETRKSNIARGALPPWAANFLKWTDDIVRIIILFKRPIPLTTPFIART